MEELKIEHLAPYINNNLMMFDSEMHLKYELCALNTEYNECSVYFNNDGDIQDFCIELLLPILYPLSHLTKEIEVNGERFIPMHYFYQKFGGGYASYESFVTHEMFCYSVEQSLYYTDAIKLFEWHFDVFGLIEKGLAISKLDL